ncbi:MAG: F0F1 ATP synthase subunit alpha, partial [Candidatus Omnitrophota bacterium]|nr:F0F1 ATP synthase subunit alpha [Candidatus Omnitrophota bacterium]
LERAGKLNSELGGGSMTFLPIVETLEGDVTGYIPSNLISMTDGQIYLNSALFSEGFKPAVDFNLSVSIVGNRVNNPILRQLSSELRFEYAQYRQLSGLTRLKAGISKESERKIRKGEIITELLIQDKNELISIEETIILLYALEHSVLDNLSDEKLKNFKKEIYGFILEFNFSLIKKLKEEKELTAGIMKELDNCLSEFFQKSEERSQKTEMLHATGRTLK